MSSSNDFPTYGRGDDPVEPDQQDKYARPAAYGPGGYGQGQQQPPGQYGPYSPYNDPTGYTPWSTQQHPSPYGPPGPHPQQPPYAPMQTVQRPVEQDPRIARFVLITAIVTAIYGFLVITVQRASLRDIAQAPGSPLNHPLRTDVIDTIGQLAVVTMVGVSVGLWIRDLVNRRRAGRQPDPVELGGFVLIGIALVPLLVWVLMVLSTGMGADDETLDRLPTAYGWGGMGLFLLAAGLAAGYRTLRPDMPSSIVQPPPQRPPWA
jgi:hypothetical protein